ncbi:MAG: hypothetical protein HY432_00500 [Candidatus Liptonbacteria bacterium]|nr:hypothetical protein [Candidatus Liptonbacteria bacterium]
MSVSSVLNKIFAALVLAAIVGIQFIYDKSAPKYEIIKLPQPSIKFVKAFDLGLDSAAAAYYWVDEAIFETPTLKYGFEKYSKDLEFINELDPRFSFPYYWTLLLLPYATNIYPGAIDAAIEIGERGAREADPDWRVYFFLATNYYLYKNDRLNAAKYFDMASREHGAPPHIKRFSANFGIAKSVREQTKQVWEVIAQSSGSDDVKARAEAYIARLNIFDFLEEKTREYKNKFGKFPDSINDLVSGEILTALPQDPFGFQFVIDKNGTAGIAK